jgi:GTP cyclohydrolase IIa
LSIQISLIKIEGYGPWTLELGSDREAQLQMLQAKLYYDLQKMFSEKDCLVYQNRQDELFAVTNGLSVEDHSIILSNVSGSYRKINLSMAIGIGTTPLDASLNAYYARRHNNQLRANVPLYGNHKYLLSSRHLNTIRSDMMVQLMHLDIDGSTRISNMVSPYEVSTFIIRIFSRIADEFVNKKSMTFYLGGDNFMIVSDTIPSEEVRSIMNSICEQLKVKLNCGIGLAKTAREAAGAATGALDTIRKLRKEGIIHQVYEIRCL